MNIPYSIKRANVSALSHHEKLERIMESSEIEALMGAARWSEHHGQHAEIEKIVQAWLRRTLERHRHRGDL